MAARQVADPVGSAAHEIEAVDSDTLRGALTRMVFAQGGWALAIAFCCFAACALMLRGVAPDAALSAWFGAGALTVVLRVPLVLRARHLPDERLPHRVHVLLCAAAGSVWGALALFWSPGLALVDHIVLIFFPVMMAIGTVAAYAPRVSLFAAFALPAQLPLVAMFLLSPDPAYQLLALPVCLCIGGEIVLVRRHHRQLRETVTLRLGNERLVEHLSLRNEALAAARDEARIASVAKSEFLARMSHEIRTPMNGVLGLAEVLETTPLDTEQARLLATLQDSARTLLMLLDELLDITSVEGGRFELERRDYAPRALLEDVLGSARHAADARSLALEWSVDERVPALVHGDPARVRQLVRNLVDNALRFTERGGVSVRLTSVGASRDGSSGGDRLVLSVADTGIGIPTDQLEQVFEPFRQGDGSSTRRVGGTGIGLTLVRAITALMDGEVRVTSAPGAGSTFVVEMPLVTADVAPSAGSSAIEPADAGGVREPVLGPPPPSPPAPALSVLVAEDNPVNQMIIEAMLEGLGCTVRIADDGAAALDALAEGGFDLILMDCQMPCVDGFEATREARGRGCRLPIVAVTANAMAGDRERCLAVGMDDYLCKPFTTEALTDVIERWRGAESATLPALA